MDSKNTKVIDKGKQNMAEGIIDLSPTKEEEYLVTGREKETEKSSERVRRADGDDTIRAKEERC